jgi:hypothetical protein
MWLPMGGWMDGWPNKVILFIITISSHLIRGAQPSPACLM